MLLQVLPVGQLEANCYIIACEETKEAAIIDPGDNGKKILDWVSKKELQIKYIICTHGHLDHIGAVDFLRKEIHCPVLIHQEDAALLTDANKNLSAYMGQPFTVQSADKLLTEGDQIPLGDLMLEIIHLPGHSPGGIAIKVGDAVFCGDSIFMSSVGRTDFPGGDGAKLVQSLKEKILHLPNETILYPGHGPSTTVEAERKHNPYLK